MPARFAGTTYALLIVMVLATSGCLVVDGVPCGGRVCAPGAVCDEERGVCLTPEQVLACEGKAELDPCSVGGAEGTCQRGACFVPFCGDGIRNGVEECEGSDLGGADCQTLGFYDTVGLACTPHCTFEVGGCTGYCGDRVANDVEICDGNIPETESCLGFGYESGQLTCRSSCVPDATGCNPGVELTVLPLTGTGTFNAVWGTGPDNVYIVGADTVMHWNGVTWTDLAPPTTFALSAVWGIGSDVFVVGGRGSATPGTGLGLILRWNGSTWTQTTSPVNEALLGVWGTSATNVFAVGGNGAAVRFNGTSWSATNSRTTANLRAIWGSGPNDIWAVGDAGTIDHWTGTQWSVTTVGTEPLEGISGTGPNDVYAVGGNGAFLRFTNNAWSVLGSFTTTPLEGVWSLGTGDILAIGSSEVYRYNNGAVDVFDTGASLNGVWASGVDNIYLAASSGSAVFMRISSWSRMAAGTTSAFTAVWGASPTDIVVVGGLGGEVVRWNGARWAVETCTNASVLRSVWGSSANDVVAVGNDGVICRWNGFTWSRISVGTGFLYGVWGSAANNVYTVGDSDVAGVGAILHWTGSTWDPDPAAAALIDSPVGVWGSGANDVYVIGNDGAGGAVVHWDGMTWSRVASPTWFPYAVWGTGPRDVFVVGSGGTIGRWNGSVWSEQVPIATATDYHAVWGTGPSNVYVAGSTIVHWNGSSWSAMRDNTAQFLQGLWGTSSGREVYAVGTSGTIMRRVRTCDSAESRCDDGDDDDCDGLIDCADADCSSDATCGSGGACAGFETLACNTTVSGATAGGATRLDGNGCDGWFRTGRERVYRVQSMSGGVMTATLSDLGRDVDLVVLAQGAAGGCDPFAPGCVATSAQIGLANETVSFAAQANATYYLVVDGFGGTSASFTLSVECP